MSPYRYKCLGDETRELMAKDIFDLKRNLNDEIREKEAVQRAAAELRNMVKNTESEKVDLNRSVQDLKQRVGSECNIFNIQFSSWWICAIIR